MLYTNQKIVMSVFFQSENQLSQTDDLLNKASFEEDKEDYLSRCKVCFNNAMNLIDIQLSSKEEILLL